MQAGHTQGPAKPHPQGQACSWHHGTGRLQMVVMRAQPLSHRREIRRVGRTLRLTLWRGFPAPRNLHWATSPFAAQTPLCFRLPRAGLALPHPSSPGSHWAGPWAQKQVSLLSTGPWFPGGSFLMTSERAPTGLDGGCAVAGPNLGQTAPLLLEGLAGLRTGAQGEL